MNMPVWRAEVLGPAQLRGPNQEALFPERKLAASLAYLALEGATSRSRLVGLLWPDSPEATARNNLSQMLRRLRLTTGRELIVGVDQVQLAPELTVDALEVRDLAAQGRLAGRLAHSGELLAGLPYDDCPDFADWLTAERERFLEWHTAAIRAELLRLEREGEYGPALSLARSMLDLDPVSEEAFRHTMRLHYLNGDRPAALKAYHRCQDTLRREFGVDPLPETAALAREIDRGTLPVLSPGKATVLPLAVQRPPHLVGREREWIQMEAAWAAGQGILLAGPPGVGKTRLAQDFLAARGPYARFEARPGDANVPYSTLTRAWRDWLTPDVGAQLPTWARQELARLAPEFGPPPPPITSQEEKLRFFAAGVELLLRSVAGPGLGGQIYDDVQYMDAASTELSTYATSSVPDAQGGDRLRRLILTYRTGELPPHIAPLLASLVDAGQFVRIELDPLPDAGSDALMDDLGVPADPAARARLREHSGGNPLFLLETVRHLIETGQSERALPERLPLPPKVGQLIGRRLTLLSPPALQAARAAATLQRDFDVELVAQVLGAPLFDVMTAWEELGAAQIVNGERFSHDAVYETVRQGIPASVGPLLHRGAAKALERGGGHPARIAEHWEEGGKPALAAPQWLSAAEQARSRYLMAECARTLRRAGDTFWAAGEQDRAFDAWSDATSRLFDLEDRAGVEAAVRGLFEHARTPRQKAVAYRLRSSACQMDRDVAGTLEAAHLGMVCAVQAGDGRLEAQLLESLFAASYLQEYPDDPTPWLTRMMEIGVALPDQDVQGTAHALFAMYLQDRRPRDARTHAEASEAIYRALGKAVDGVSCAQKSVRACLTLGDLKAAEAGLRRMAAYLDTGEGLTTQRLLYFEKRAVLALARGEYGAALVHLGHALDLTAVHQAVWQSLLQGWRVKLLTELGAREEAHDTAQTLLAALPGSANRRPEPRVLALEALADLGDVDAAKAALRAVEQVPFAGVYWGARRDLAHALLLPAAQRLPLLDTVLNHARAYGLEGVALAAEVRRNAARLDLGLAPLPWEADAGRHPAGVIGVGEWLGVRARVAQAQGDGETALAALQTWIRRTAELDVPPEYRTSFLGQPRLRALLQGEAARL